MLSDAAFVVKYQTLIGELLYFSVNTMPEIGSVMSCLTRYMTIPTQKVGEYAKEKCHYLLCNNALVHQGIIYIWFRVSVGSSHVVSPGSLSRPISALISAPSKGRSPG